MKKYSLAFLMIFAATPSYASTLYANSTSVGIGTTSPGTTLDVNGALTMRGITAPSVSASGQGIIYFDSTTNEFEVSQNGGAYTPLGGAGSSQWTTTGSNIYYDTGNVGIGTTSPTAPLYVYHVLPTGTISSSSTTVTGSGSNFTTAFAVGDMITSGTQTQTISTITNDTSLTTTSAFSPALSSGSTYERFGAILNAGAVGIGTSLPQLPLDVMALPIINGPDRSVATFADNSAMAANVGGGIQFAGYTASGIRSGLGSIRSGKTNGTSGDYGAYMAFNTRTNGSLEAERMRIDNLGNVGIGTTTISYTLQVNGSVAGTSAYVNTSDERLKKDIKPIAYGLNTVMKLNPVSFDWKQQDQDWKKKHQIGLVAQQVEPVVPEVVTTANDSAQTKSIAYGSLVPILIKAIQDLKAENDNQAKAINELRQDFDVYKKEHR